MLRRRRRARRHDDGFLLARAGVDVVVLEKHADFLRDFRGDTVHPSTLQIIYELGLLDAFLQLPHQKVGPCAAKSATSSSWSRISATCRPHCRFVLLMPQWDFLDFIAAQATPLPGLQAPHKCEATDLIEEGGRVVGLHAATADGELRSAAASSSAPTAAIRSAAKAGLVVDALGAPMDVLWFRVSRSASDPAGSWDLRRRPIFVMINRGDYWQCGYVIAKGALDAGPQAGLPAFREQILVSRLFWASRRASLTTGTRSSC